MGRRLGLVLALLLSGHPASAALPFRNQPAYSAAQQLPIRRPARPTCVPALFDRIFARTAFVGSCDRPALPGGPKREVG